MIDYMATRDHTNKYEIIHHKQSETQQRVEQRLPGVRPYQL
jgi:hypothetical protein